MYWTIIIRDHLGQERNISADLCEGPWDTREDAEWFAANEVREEVLRVVPCDSGEQPPDGPDGAIRPSVPDTPANWRTAHPAWKRPVGAVRVSTKVLPGGRVEVAATELREGEAVDVYVAAAEGASSSENVCRRRP